MSDAVAGEPLARLMTGLRDARVGLAIGLAVMAILFHAEIAAAVHTWIISTAYNHCFLVIPIAIFLIWDRRSELHGLNAAPTPRAALLILPLAVIWLAAERLGIMEGRQLAVITMVEVLFLAMLGPRLWFAMLGPLLYLYFLVPFGEFLTPQLQDFTTWFIRHGVDVLGIPTYIDGYVIDIPEGSFFVAEACAGLRFLIASIAFGVLYALLMYRGIMRRTLFIAASIIVPIIANGFRALGIVWLGHVLGSAEAAATDHILYGWIFFSLVILLLIVAGLPFREDEHAPPPNARPMMAEPGAPRQGLLTGFTVAALAALGPVLVAGLNQASATPNVAPSPLDLGSACVNQGAPSAPDTNPPGRLILQRVNCGGTAMTVAIEVFAPRSTAGPVNAERRRLTRVGGSEDWLEVALPATNGDNLPPWRVVRGSDPNHISAVGAWIDGDPSAPGMAMRVSMARDSVFGGVAAPVLVVISPVADWEHVDMAKKKALENAVASVVQARSDIGAQVRRLAEAAR